MGEREYTRASARMPRQCGLSHRSPPIAWDGPHSAMVRW